MGPELDVALAVVVGVALAACAGLRAFLPMLAAGILARAGQWELHASFDWLASTPALIALAVAALIEIAADKVPALDHFLDAAQTPVRAMAGGLVAAAAFAPLPTWAAFLLGIVAGSSTALSVHAAKAALRIGSTATTGGLMNPLISVAEDVAATVASVLVPVLAVAAAIVFLLAVGALALAARLVSKRWRRAPSPA